MKTLIFEGAGWEEAESSILSGVGNCRIRTRIKNNIGRVIYLEMGGFEVSKNEKREMYKNLNFASHVNHCFYNDAKWDTRSNHSAGLRHIEHTATFEYNKENVLKFVNENLNCSFDNIEVINDNSVRVHDTKEPLCNCNNGNYEPFKDIEININVLDNIQQVHDFKDKGFAQYTISYDFVKEQTYLKKYIQERTQREQKQYKNFNYYANLRWDKNGIINSLEISARQNFCNMCLSAEDLQSVIDEIIRYDMVIAV